MRQTRIGKRRRGGLFTEIQLQLVHNRETGEPWVRLVLSDGAAPQEAILSEEDVHSLLHGLREGERLLQEAKAAWQKAR
jgi:hypothetical protein